MPTGEELVSHSLPGLRPENLRPRQNRIDEVELRLVDMATDRRQKLAVEGRRSGDQVAAAEEAVAALGPRSIRIGEFGLSGALAWMAWAAASGGAHGKRPGAAAGRFAARWTLAALTDLLEPFPPDEGELGEAGASLKWYLWDDLAPSTGWVLRLAAEDPEHGLAWAMSATDAE